MHYTVSGVSRILAVFLCLWGLAGSVDAADARVGDTIDAAREKMGRPTGEVRHGEQLILLYDRGTVEAYQGHVVQVDLMSTVDLRDQREKSERAMAQHRRKIRAERNQRVAAGRRELARVERDEEGFAKKPVSEQVAYWNDFKRKYPDAELPGAYGEAHAALAEEQAAERKKRETDALAAASVPTKKLSSGKQRKLNRRMVPGEAVETPPHVVKYRQVGGSIKQWPYD